MKKILKRVLSPVLVFALSAAILSGCSTSVDRDDTSNVESTPSPSPSESYVFKFANVVADDHPYNLGAAFFKETLEASAAEAGYDVTVEIYSNSALGGERELAESMQLGALDMALIPGCAVSFNPMFGLFDLPYLFESREVAHTVLDGEIGQEIAANMPQESGLRLLAYWENGFRNMTNSRREISTPEDVNGITIRVPENEVYVSFFSALGANVVTMSFSELYTALQQKTVDGQENPTALIATNKLYETQTYMSLTEHFYGPAQLCFSESIWQTLPSDLQVLIQSAAEEARDYERQCCVDLDASYLEEIESSGTQINNTIDKSLFQPYAQQVYEQYWDVYGPYIECIQNGDY
mgnify:CR=1 FL=1